MLMVVFVLVLLVAIFALVAPRPESLAHVTPLDRLLRKMDWGNIAFNSPKTMVFGEAKNIQLLLSAAKTPDQLANLLQDSQNAEKYSIKFSDQMEARLTGTGFEIKPITKEAQSVSGQGVTEWKWEVTPKRFGAQHLHLALDAKIKLDGDDAPHTIRTFEQDVAVTVAWPGSILYFVQEYWQWICTAVAFPIIVWLVKRCLGGKDSGDEDKSDDADESEDEE